tara:strand:- start:209 stop:1369 length:1161 start_codon:yes stop_codon:yes gene_type:complete
MIRKLFIPGLILLASIFGAGFLVATSPKLEPTSVGPIATTVRTLTAEPKAVRLEVQSQGSVVPNTETELIPEVSGRVVWMSPSLVKGGYFEKNELLLRIEENDYKSQLLKAKSALARAEAEFEHTKFEFQRIKSLETRKLASRSQMENTQRAYRVAKALLNDAKATVDQAQRDLKRTAIYAPFNGLVKQESVDIGQFINRGGIIASLYASDEAEVRLPIADRQLAFLNLPVGHRGELPKEQQPNVTLKARYAGQDLVWDGTIVRTESQIDLNSRMVHVIAKVVNKEQAVPLSVGLFVNAEIEGLLVQDIISLPRTALRNGDQVLIVDEDNRLRYREIKALRLYKDEVLVQAGIKPGEKVCLSPLQTAIDGMLVNPITDNNKSGQAG